MVELSRKTIKEELRDYDRLRIHHERLRTMAIKFMAVARDEGHIVSRRMCDAHAELIQALADSH